MCMTDYDDCAWWSFGNRWVKRARRAHRCDECNRAIEAGERYKIYTGVGDGHFIAHKVCEQCDAAARWLQDVCDGYLLEMIFEDLREHIGEYPTIALRRLVDAMEHNWIVQRGPRKGQRRSVFEVHTMTRRALDAHDRRWMEPIRASHAA